MFLFVHTACTILGFGICVTVPDRRGHHSWTEVLVRRVLSLGMCSFVTIVACLRTRLGMFTIQGLLGKPGKDACPPVADTILGKKS